MAINLSKGQRVSLDKGVRLALVGLGWDTNRYDGAADFDLDTVRSARMRTSSSTATSRAPTARSPIPATAWRAAPAATTKPCSSTLPRCRRMCRKSPSP